MQNQYMPNILFVGRSRVGKTSLIGKISGHDMDYDSSKPTIKSDFVRRPFKIGKSSHHVTLIAKIYDQQFELQSSPPSIMRYQDIIVLVWSLTDTESYRNLDQHLKTIHSIYDTNHHGQPDIVLCANKCDSTKREEEFSLCCEKHDQYKIVKTSATIGTGIQTLESIICEILLTRYNKRSDKELSISLESEVPDDPSEPNCCM